MKRALSRKGAEQIVAGQAGSQTDAVVNVSPGVTGRFLG